MSEREWLRQRMVALRADVGPDLVEAPLLPLPPTCDRCAALARAGVSPELVAAQHGRQHGPGGVHA